MIDEKETFQMLVIRFNQYLIKKRMLLSVVGKAESSKREEDDKIILSQTGNVRT